MKIKGRRKRTTGSTMAPQSKSIKLTLQRRRWIIECREEWMQMQGSINTINLTSAEWRNYLCSHLKSKDTDIQTHDVERWLSVHSWITHPREIKAIVASTSVEERKESHTRQTKKNEPSEKADQPARPKLLFVPSSYDDNTRPVIPGGSEREMSANGLKLQQLTSYGPSSPETDDTLSEEEMHQQRSASNGSKQASCVTMNDKMSSSASQVNSVSIGASGPAPNLPPVTAVPSHVNNVSIAASGSTPNLPPVTAVPSHVNNVSIGASCPQPNLPPVTAVQSQSKLMLLYKIIGQIEKYGYVTKDHWNWNARCFRELDPSRMNSHVEIIVTGMIELVTVHPELFDNPPLLIATLKKMLLMFNRINSNVVFPVRFQDAMKMPVRIEDIKSEPMDVDD